MPAPCGSRSTWASGPPWAAGTSLILRCPPLPVLEPGKLVLEVKFTEFLPQIVRDLLPPRAQELTAVSKYVLCCDKTAYQHGFTYWNEP